MRKVLSPLLLAFQLWVCYPALATSIPVATVSLSSDFPSPGVQEIAITNDTGANGCTAYYLACDNLAITDWTLTVDYTSNYYNNPAPVLASPDFVSWQSPADNILPSAPLTLDFDLCGTQSVSSCASPTTTITQIVLTGTLSQSTFTVFDPTANGGAGGPGPTFFSDPSFTLVFTPSAAYPGSFYETQDGFVTNAAPEPGTAVLPLGGLCVACWLRRRAIRA